MAAPTASPPLVILVTYCSNERAYADALLTAAARVADLVVVAVGNRLFTGAREDVAHVDALAARHPAVAFAWYDVPDALLPTPIPLHNRARVAARDAALRLLDARRDDYWAILLDADEVPRDGGARLKAWWERIAGMLDPLRPYKLANRWFFLHPSLVAESWEDSIVLVHGRHLTDEALQHPRERDGVCFVTNAKCGSGSGSGSSGTVNMVPGLDGEPMIDHFSWVRAGRRQLLDKVQTWGHKHDRDWTALVNAAYDGLERGEFPTHEFVHGRKLIRLHEV